MSLPKTIKRITKKNGEVVRFDTKKVVNSITKAGEASGEFDEKKAKALTVKVIYLAQQLYGGTIPSSEDIASVVEEILMKNYKNTAKLFILHRDQKQRQDEITSIANVSLTNKYLKRKDWKVKENSNVGFSLQGLNHYVSTEITKTYWLNAIYPKDIRDAHKSGDFHIHDLGSLSAYCCGWDLFDLLTIGFTGEQGKVESRPAKHLRTALGQIVNFIFTLQNECAGAQAFSNLDTLLAPFIYYDKLEYSQVKQAIQEFIYNLNVTTRQGNQSPFSNITLDLQPSVNFAKQSVIIGGQPQEKTYGEFQKEMDIFNKAFLEVMVEGDAKGRIFTFPVVTYNITKDFEWNNPNLDLLWQVTGKYGIPYFCNYINSDMSPEDARSMCCRLRLDNRELIKRGGGLFGSSPLTGSIGVVTLNMPRLGYLAKNKKDFFDKLDHLLVVAKNSLEIKREVVEKFSEEGLYPYSKFYLRSVKKRFDQYWKNHFSTIGLVGMNEACLNLLEKNIGTPEGLQFTKEVLDYMNDKLIEFQKETGNFYNLEATPAEGCATSLALKDKKYDEKIISANEVSYKTGATPYYTNSVHLPVSYTEDIFEVLDLQDELQTKFTGGTVIHLYLGESVQDTTVIKKLIKKICGKYKLPYFSLTPTFSICQIHGYLSGEHEYCPKCDQEIGYKEETNDGTEKGKN